MLRWQLLFIEYDIIYMTKKVVKGSTITDHLANNIVEDYELLYFDLLDENVLATEDDGEKNGWWTIFLWSNNCIR